MVVRWRGGDEVHRCLRSLIEHGGDHLDRVVLVDSGSGDDGAERLAREFPDVDVVALSENLSFAWAADQGFLRCSERYLLLLNPDTELSIGCLDSLVEFLEARSTSAGVVPLLIDADGRPQHRWQLRRLPGPRRLAAGSSGPPTFSAEHLIEPARVEQPAAAAWLVRRTVWHALDGLDAAFTPAWWEDVDFCARLKASIGRPDFPVDDGFWVVPRARVLHGGGSSLAHLGQTAFLTAYNTNLLRYARRHHPGHLPMIRTGLRFSLLARALLHPSQRRAYFDTLHAIRSATLRESQKQENR